MFGMQGALALKFLHDQDYVHNCVTTHAIHLVDDRRIKLTELGYMTKVEDESLYYERNHLGDGNNTTKSRKTISTTASIHGPSSLQIPEAFWRWLPGEIFIDNEAANYSTLTVGLDDSRNRDKFGTPTKYLDASELRLFRY